MLLFLVGYMACGKSTIGRKLHQRLRWPLHDTDKIVVEQEGMTIAELFDSRGEEYFRGCESGVINKLIDSESSAIISTGGGAPVWGDNMRVMNEAGATVYISRTAGNIAKRLSPHGRAKRPKLRDLSDSELVESMQRGIDERDACYRQSKLIIEADDYSDEMIVDTIMAYIKGLRG